MANLNFPSNPINGQTYTLNGAIYYYNSTIGGWLTQQSSSTIATGSSNTQVLFNDAGSANGSLGLTYNKTANTLYANTLLVSGNMGVGNTSPNLKVEVAGDISVQNFIEFSANINYNYTITTGRNALTAGPVSIASGNTVTIPSGSFWTVT